MFCNRTIDCVVSERKQTDSGVPSENQNITGATVNDGVSSIIGSVDYPVADLEERYVYTFHINVYRCLLF